MATKIRRSRIEKYYQKIVAVFIILTILIAALIIYFSFSRTIIFITPKIINHNIDFRLMVSENATMENGSLEKINGKIMQVTVEKTKNFSYVTEADEIPAKATGKVTIYNNHSSAQPLVETTRLMSENNILFRTMQTVTVPAGGSIEVEVIADKAGKTGDIGPGKFTIVALWPGLQEKIFAQSDIAMTGGIKKATVVTLENINKAKTELIDELKNLGIQEIQKLLAEQDKNKTLISEAVYYKIIDQSISAEENDEVSNFNVFYKIQVTIPLLEISDIDEYSTEKLKNSLTSDMRIYNEKQIKYDYQLENIDLEKNTATLKINAICQTIIKISSPIFDRNQLTSKDKHEINVYFSQFDDLIQSIEVDFNPFWVVKSPQLKDHIEIEIKNPE